MNPTLLHDAIVAVPVQAVSLALMVFWWRRAEVEPGAWAVHVRCRQWRMRLPTLRLAGWQCLITLLDVTLAAATLYVLLPHAPAFPAFVIIYLLALAGGVLSHVPGGVGVFETIMLAGLSHHAGLAPLTAALVLYRLIYVVLPLLLGCLALLLIEARRSRHARTALNVASGMAAPTLSLQVFLTGVVLLFSGVTPAVSARLEVLGELVPHRLVDASHLAASLIGGQGADDWAFVAVECAVAAQGAGLVGGRHRTGRGGAAAGVSARLLSTQPADSGEFIRRSLHDYAEGKRLICGLYVHQERVRLIGLVSFNEIMPATGRASLGYWLGARWQGRGLMTQACQAMTQLAFKHYDLQKVQISAATGNTRSRAVCERLGARLEGVITRAESVNGVVHDHAVYGLDRDIHH